MSDSMTSHGERIAQIICLLLPPLCWLDWMYLEHAQKLWQTSGCVAASGLAGLDSCQAPGMSTMPAWIRHAENFVKALLLTGMAGMYLHVLYGNRRPGSDDQGTKGVAIPDTAPKLSPDIGMRQQCPGSLETKLATPSRDNTYNHHDHGTRLRFISTPPPSSKKVSPRLPMNGNSGKPESEAAKVKATTYDFFDNGPPVFTLTQGCTVSTTASPPSPKSSNNGSPDDQQSGMLFSAANAKGTSKRAHSPSTTESDPRVRNWADSI